MKVQIYGDYVDGDCYGDEISPSKFRALVAPLKKGEPLEVHVNSLGGSVTSGIAIANTLRELSKSGHRTTCVVEGVAASIASITAMACDEIQIYPSAFIMIHNPWTMLMGDAATLRKEADTLDKMRSALLAFYRPRFDRTDAEIVALMDAETWISGEECAAYGLSVTLLDDAKESRAAAKATLRNALAKLYATRINEEKLMAKKDEEKKPDEIVETETPAAPTETPAAPEEPAEPAPEQKPDEEEKADGEEKPAEEPAEPAPDEEREPTVEELKAIIAELEKKVAELEEQKDPDVDGRVSKCQSVFQNKINDLKCEMTAKDEELRNAKADASRLEDSLKNAEAELAKAQAAAEESRNALASLTANALAHVDELPTFEAGLAKCKTPEERSAFIASGKFKK